MGCQFYLHFRPLLKVYGEVFFKLFKYLKRTNGNIAIPRITNSYQVRYEQFVPVSSSAIENFVLIKEMAETKCEEKRVQLLSKVTKSLRALNELELKVFDLVFYKNTNEEEIMIAVAYGKDKVREIRKSACIKFLSCLGLDNQCLKEDVLLAV